MNVIVYHDDDDSTTVDVLAAVHFICISTFLWFRKNEVMVQYEGFVCTFGVSKYTLPTLVMTYMGMKKG